MTLQREVEDLIQRMTPDELAHAMGGTVEVVREPLSVRCATCGQPAGSRCRRQSSAPPGSGKAYSGVYDGAETDAHPLRRGSTTGVRVVGPFIPDSESAT